MNINRSQRKHLGSINTIYAQDMWGKHFFQIFKLTLTEGRHNRVSNLSFPHSEYLTRTLIKMELKN